MMRKSIVILVFLLSGTYGFCAKKITSISSQDEKSIRAEAEETFGKYQSLLRILASKIIPSQMDQQIDQAFVNGTQLRIFYSQEVSVDDETRSTPRNPQKTEIKQYLESFYTSFGRYNDNDITLIKAARKPRIRIIEAGQGLQIKLWFRQLIKGTYPDGTPMDLKFEKVMSLLVQRSKNGKWTTLIYEIDFASRPDNTENAPQVDISDAAKASNLPPQKPGYSDDYYRTKLLEGQRLKEKNNFEAAYYFLLEAKNGEPTSAAAEKEIHELMIRLRDREPNQNPSETLYKDLVKRALKKKREYRLDLARKYLEYAIEEDPSSEGPKGELEEIDSIEQRQDQLLGQLDGNNPDEARKIALAEKERDPENPFWHIGLAKAYEQLNKPEEAEAEFNIADAKSNHPDIDRWHAVFYEHRLDYDSAYKKLKNLRGRTEDPWDPKIMADIAYCKGRMLLAAQEQSQFQEALDSFRQAATYLPGNKAALVGQAEALTLLRKRDEAKGIIRIVLEDADATDENTLGDAWHLLGVIDEREEKKDKALEAFVQAVSHRKDRASYFFDLGALQLEMKRFSDARSSFNQCIKVSNPLLCLKSARVQQRLQAEAIWKIGKCFYFEHNDVETQRSYDEYYKANNGKAYIPPDFYADIANFYLRRTNWNQATEWLARSKKDNASTLLSRSILSFVTRKDTSAVYERRMDEAFNSGLRKSEFLNAPQIEYLYRDSKLIRTIVRDKWNIKNEKSIKKMRRDNDLS